MTPTTSPDQRGEPNRVEKKPVFVIVDVVALIESGTNDIGVDVNGAWRSGNRAAPGRDFNPAISFLKKKNDRRAEMSAS